MGSPYAVKAARTVTTGGMGKHRLAVRPVPTHLGNIRLTSVHGRMTHSRRSLMHKSLGV
jgi:hypothetical protein